MNSKRVRPLILMCTILAGLLVLGHAGIASAQAKKKSKSKSSSKPPMASKSDPAPAGAVGQMPWSLRDCYKFNKDKRQLVVAVETGTWRLLSEGQGPVIDDAGFSITLADGTVWDATNLGKAATERMPHEDALGKATNFWLEFPSRSSVVVREEIIMYSEQPFMLFRLLIGNNGDKPLEISKISQMVPGLSGITNLGADTRVSSRTLRSRGGLPVYDKLASPVMTMFNDRTNGWTLALGVLSSGAGVAKSEFTPSGSGAYRGEISCTFDPPITIAPGTKFQADPLWISFSLAEPGKVDMYYAWSWVKQPHIAIPEDAPKGWAALGDACSEADVLGAAQEWAGAQVKHVLVPGTWEGRPGSLEGAVPRFPKNMDKVADKVHAAGAKVGLTVDPLATGENNAAFTVTTPDGRRWINLSNAEGRAKAVETMKKVNEWGFDFYVIQPSLIPNEALAHFDMSRAQADQLSFGVMAEAAQGKAVFPSAAAGAVKPEVDEWLKAAGCSGRMAEFGLPSGPVRFDVTGINEIDATQLAAMSFYAGPIEFAGRPSSGVSRQLAHFMSKPRLAARAVDSDKASPKIWQIRSYQGGKPCGGSIVTFPGAGSLELAQVELDSQEPVRVWRAADGQFVDPAQPSIALDETMSVFGVMPTRDYPALMGASYGFGLLLNDVKDLVWDAQKNVLSGVFLGSNLQPANAYVSVPEGWALDSGKVEGGSIQKGAPHCVQFPVAAGKSTKFTLQFLRK